MAGLLNLLDHRGSPLPTENMRSQFDIALTQRRAEALIKLLEDEIRDSRELIHESERLQQHVAHLLHLKTNVIPAQ